MLFYQVQGFPSTYHCCNKPAYFTTFTTGGLLSTNNQSLLAALVYKNAISPVDEDGEKKATTATEAAVAMWKGNER